MRAARRTETPDTDVSPLRRLVGGSRSRGPGHEHLVDAVAVHVHDLKGEPVPLKAVARRRHAPEVGHHHPAYGLVVLLLLVGQSTQPNTFFKLFGGQQAVHQPGAVSPLHYRRLAVLLEVANEGLEDVGRRDEPLDIAALVDHEGQGQDGSLERRERLRSGSAFREERWAPQGSQQIDRPSFSDLLGKGVFDRDHAQQIVEIAPGDRVVRVPAISRRCSSGGLSAFSQTMLGRGVISARIGRSSSLSARWARSLSSSSKTPACAPSSSRISTSRSLTGGSAEGLTLRNRNTASVDTLRNQTAGEARVERKRMGPATREAIVSAPFSARRLGTSSPRISER